MLYIATGRLSLVGVGATMFLGGATFFANSVSHVQDRVAIWLDPWPQNVVDDEGYQVAQSVFAQADGGLFGQGFGQALLELPGGGTLLPAADTDLIYAVVVNEIGLFGAAALLLAYLLFAVRGFRIALQAPDDFSKLLAAGLTSVFALQVFVIVGGVTQGDPADRRDAALRLLRGQLDHRQHGPAGPVADRLRRGSPRPQPPGRAGLGMNAQIIKLFGLFAVLFALLVGFTSWWSVLDADKPEGTGDNRRALIEEQTIPRGLIFARDGRTVLARNIARGPREDTPRARNLRTFVRTYPEGPAVRARGGLLVPAQRAARARAVREPAAGG